MHHPAARGARRTVVMALQRGQSTESMASQGLRRILQCWLWHKSLPVILTKLADVGAYCAHHQFDDVLHFSIRLMLRCRPITVTKPGEPSLAFFSSAASK